jgi:hypothetical protein
MVNRKNTSPSFYFLYIFVAVIITAALFEVFLQVVHLKGEALKGTSFERLSRYTDPPLSWERTFLTRYKFAEEGNIPLLAREGLHKPHKTRGWVLRANLKNIVDEKRYATNSDGFRSLYEYKYDPKKYGVLVVGDSFTFGDGVHTRDTWPNLLSETDKGLNVFNLAGSGYGIDQMYLTLTEEIERYKPKLVIAAFIDNNLHRSLLDFRDYKKPRFVLDDNELILTNTPIEGTEVILRELEGKKIDNYSGLQILNVLRRLTGNMYATNYKAEPRSGDFKNGCAGECRKLNIKLIEEMARAAKENNARFMLVYLPRDDELKFSDYRTYGEEFFKRYRASHKEGHEYLNPREAFLTADYNKAVGHYTLAENKIVSEEVYGLIRGFKTIKKKKKD